MDEFFNSTGFFSRTRRVQIQVSIDNGLYVTQYDREYCLDDSELMRKLTADIRKIIVERDDVARS